jgi:2Fe-2S ferredoxin
VTFEPAGVTVEHDPAVAPAKARGRPGCLLDVALTSGVGIEHACGGAGVCGTCHVIVTKGTDGLSPPTDDELDVVDLAPAHTPESRLACQAVVRGDVTVRVPDWNRNLVSEKG